MTRIRVAIATAVVAVGTLSGCDRINSIMGRDSTAIPATAQREGQELADASRRARQSRVAGFFWLNGTTLGCVLPSGSFTVFRFKDGVANVENAGGKFDASVEFAPSKPQFQLTYGKFGMEFSPVGLDKPSQEHHILRFSTRGKVMPCFTWANDQYVPHDGSNPDFIHLVGAWTCSGDIGKISFDASGRFQRNGQTGSMVVSSPADTRQKSKLHLLGGSQGNPVVAAVVSLDADLSGLSKQRLSINGQSCSKG